MLYLIEILHQTTTVTRATCPNMELYLIEILHQTTTPEATIRTYSVLYLIEILHQTTTFSKLRPFSDSCILSKFYIKPQHPCSRSWFFRVVSYRNSTSNHNSQRCQRFTSTVVSYRNSTSNHNVYLYEIKELKVVSYRNSTSNHNVAMQTPVLNRLYLIEILHQTTTSGLILIDKVLLTGCLPL